MEPKKESITAVIPAPVELTKVETTTKVAPPARRPPGGARYTGDGSAYIGGVPARSLTADEWHALTDEQREACLATGLYKASQLATEG